MSDDRIAEFAQLVAWRIRQYRAEHRITQLELAKLTGLTMESIVKLETGKYSPSLTTLTSLTTHTGMCFRIGDDG